MNASFDRWNSWKPLRRLLPLLLLEFLLFQYVSQSVSGSSLRVSSIQSNGWVRIRGESDNAVTTLEASSNLVHWRVIAVLHGYSFDFTDPVSPELPHRFYRFSSSPLSLTNDWKNQVGVSTHYYDKFSVSLASDYYVKFAITTNEPARVYYADGRQFLFHYDFATTRLDSFTGFTHDQFDQAALYNEGRQIILGAVIFPGFRARPILEYGIQFVSRDPLPRELVRALFELVESTVVTDFRAIYIPSFEQFRFAEADRGWFETNGIPIASTDRWADDNTC